MQRGFPMTCCPSTGQQALEFIRRELQAAEQSGLNARILVPLTRGQGGEAALQFEVELANLTRRPCRSSRPRGARRSGVTVDPGETPASLRTSPATMTRSYSFALGPLVPPTVCGQLAFGLTLAWNRPVQPSIGGP